MTLDDKIMAALHQVCDPCSIAANAPISIVDMGLVRDWSVDEGGNLVVRMCVTSPSCTMAPHMVRGVEELLSQIHEIASVSVEVDPLVFWTPDEMTDSGKEILAGRRERSLSLARVEPKQWRKVRQ